MGEDASHSRDVVRLVRGGHAGAIRMVRDAGRTLGEVLAGTVNFFNPAVIVIGGDIAEAHAQLLAGVREGIFSRSLPLATRDLRIVPCRLGDRAGVIGAAIMAIEHVLAPMRSTARSSPPPEGSPYLRSLFDSMSKSIANSVNSRPIISSSATRTTVATVSSLPRNRSTVTGSEHEPDQREQHPEDVEEDERMEVADHVLLAHPPEERLRQEPRDRRHHFAQADRSLRPRRTPDGTARLARGR